MYIAGDQNPVKDFSTHLEALLQLRPLQKKYREFDAIVHSGFVEDALKMVFYRLDADAELFGDVPIAYSRYHQCDDLFFPWGQSTQNASLVASIFRFFQS